MANEFLPNEQYLRVRGLKIRYCVVGEGEPVLLVHGLGAMMEYWYETIPSLAARYQVIALDLPGFGKSEAPSHYSIEYYADFLAAFLDALNMSSLSVVAHSLGGGVALKFIASQRARIHKLALLSNVGFATQLGWMFRFLTLPGASLLLRNFSLKEYAATLRANTANPMSITDAFIEVAYPIVTQPEVQKVLFAILKKNASIFGIKMRSLIPIQAGFSHLQDLPMQIYWGKQDPVLLFEPHTEAAKRFFPKAELIALDACGHLPQIEKSHLINEGLREFLG